MNHYFLLREAAFSYDDEVRVNYTPLPHQHTLIMIRSFFRRLSFFFLGILLLFGCVLCVHSGKLLPLFQLHVKDFCEALRKEL